MVIGSGGGREGVLMAKEPSGRRRDLKVSEDHLLIVYWPRAKP
jgi:hypothetical protein